METPASGEDAINPSAKLPWLSRYVSAQAFEIVDKVADELRDNAPEPFSGWQRWTTDVPRLGSAVFDRLRRHLIDGGIVILVGRPSFSKVDLLTSLTAADDAEAGLQGAATVPDNCLPPPPFAIDDTSQYARDGVLTSIALATSQRRGFILVFQNAAEFRAFDIGSYIANQKVVILEFSTN